MNLTINFLGSANRAWRAARFPIDVIGVLPGLAAGRKPKLFGKTATLVAVNSAEIECKFYTPKGNQLQDVRSVNNYHVFGFYRAANFGKIEPPVEDPMVS